MVTVSRDGADSRRPWIVRVYKEGRLSKRYSFRLHDKAEAMAEKIRASSSSSYRTFRKVDA